LPGARYPDSQEMSLFFVWLALRMTTLASRVNCTRQRQGIGLCKEFFNTMNAHQQEISLSPCWVAFDADFIEIVM